MAMNTATWMVAGESLFEGRVVLRGRRSPKSSIVCPAGRWEVCRFPSGCEGGGSACLRPWLLSEGSFMRANGCILVTLAQVNKTC